MSRNLIAYYERQATRYDHAADAFRALLTHLPRAPDEDRECWIRSAAALDSLATDYRKTANRLHAYRRPIGA